MSHQLEMARSCGRCQSLETYKYWYQLPSDKHQFFKVMFDGFRLLLRIPAKFTTYFKEELASTVSLQGPSGNKWTVELTRNDEDVIFQNGWEKFALDHSLEEADFLVFRYSGNSSFVVSIFDASGCERESAYYVEKHKKSCPHSGTVEEKMKEGCVEINEAFVIENEEESLQEGSHKNGSLNEVSETSWFEGDLDKQHMLGRSKGKEVKGNTSSSGKQRTVLQGEETECDSSIYAQTGYQQHPRQEKYIEKCEDKIESSGRSVLHYHSLKRDGKGERISNLILDESKDESVKIIDISEHEGHSQKMCSSNSCIPTKTDKNLGKEAQTAKSVTKLGPMRRAAIGESWYPGSSKSDIWEDTEKNQANQSSVSPLKITIQHKNVSKDFIKEIPDNWVAKLLPNKVQPIQLRTHRSKNKWAAQIRYASGIWKLTGGWSNFVLDNNLEKHDVCIFELATLRPIVLDVFIHRASGSRT